MIKVQDLSKAVSNGKIFSVTFRKVNGDIRKMICRTGVKKGLKGAPRYNAIDKNILNVYDVKANGFRCFKCENIISMKIQGNVYEVMKQLKEDDRKIF